ncbi:MAG: class I SAM-dependent methyltransferase [Magnetococcales bacterium]|nr:class I SAM-dependent methyltransferase [Magnetococcales bacterium]
MTHPSDPSQRNTPDIHAGSPDRFGYSHVLKKLLDIHVEQFDGWTAALPRELWKEASFLDVGCGMGRNSLWATQRGAGPGVAIDVDEGALAFARDILRAKTDVPVDVRWMSAYQIDFQDHFDIAFSLGVIHHLENPELAVRNMTKATKPGGRVLVWLYGRENNGWIVHLFNPVRRFLFSRLPIRITDHLSWGLAVVLWVMLHLGWGRLPYHDLLRKTTLRHLKQITFDHMLPQIALYYRREEAENLLRQAGLTDIVSVWTNQMSWSVSGVKPQTPTAPSAP